MTNFEMLARLRTMLDESTEIFYDDDTELYPALTLAQLEMVKTIADGWRLRIIKGEEPVKMPLAIMPLRQLETAAVETVGQKADTISDPPIQAVSFFWNPDGLITAGGRQCVELSQGGTALRMMETPYLDDGYYYWWEELVVYFNPPATVDTAQWSLEFIGYPSDITSVSSPAIDSVAHDAVVERACWILLKDRESEQASAHLQMYSAMMKGLMT